jgi:exportin-5
MRKFVLSRDAILERLILFCIHALRMHDSRCCGMIIRVFRSLIPEFVKGRDEIREIICREVLMASIDVSWIPIFLPFPLITNLVSSRRLFCRCTT